jgi:hypothetical protein
MPRETPKAVILAAIRRWKDAKGTPASEIARPENSDARLGGRAGR